MAATEIANAYISLTTRMPGVKNDIAKALGGSDVSSVVSKSGSSMGEKLLSGIGTSLKVGAVALGGVIAAGIGTALVKGFQRLDAIDTASAKLRGLGNDASTVDTIMANALASVKGTAFGLGDAATVAAQAVAAGIKPGKDLEQILGTVANTAAAAGTDLGEMGSIFSKAMTQANGVQNDVISQLADRGIPIYQALADQLGVTAGEVFKMASEGKINFETFAAAATAASGTVASEMGGTWSGAFDNFMASLGRVGEGLLAGLFPQVKDGLQDVTSFLAPFESGAKEVGAAIGGFVADAGPKFVEVLKGIWEAGGNVVNWVKDNVTWLAPLVVGIGSATAVWVAWTGAISLWNTITKIATAAQIAFNVAIRANPIGAIVTAITALVAGLVWFFTQTELGKEIWANFTRFLGEAWTNITGFFTAAYENVIKPVLTGIGDTAKWLYENVLKPVFDGISGIVGFFAAGFKLQFDLIVNAFRLVAAIAGWFWVNALQPVFNAIGDVVTWLWKTIVEPYFNAWGAIFNWLWVTIIKPVADGIGSAIEKLGIGFSWLYVNMVKPAFDGISQAMKSAWSWIETYVFAPFNAGIGLLGKAFDDTAKAIGIAWDGIKVAAASPINFVLDTVWNNGLRSFWNDLVGNLGLSDMKLPKAELVKFANGTENHVAQIAGPGAMRLWAEPETGGEAYIPLSPSKRGRSSAILADVANRFGMTLLPFKNGGIWGDMANFAGDVWDNIASAASVAGEFLSNPAAAIQKHVIDGIIKPLIGDGNMLIRAVGQLPINLVKNLADSFAGASAGGTAGMGWQKMWDIVKANVPGAVMTSGYRSPSGNAAVGGAKGSYHMQGRAIDLVPASMAMFNAVARLFPNATELIYTPAGDRQLRNGKPFNGWSAGVRAQHYSHVHLAMANGGVIPKLYDQGGWIPHGGMAVNLSGKPEAVLDPAQSAALRDGRFGGIRPGDEVVFVVEGKPFTAIAERVVSSAFPTAGAVTSQFAR